MRAWVVDEHGAPDTLCMRDVPPPTCGKGEVRVAVAYAAVNFADGLMTRGRYQVSPPLPFTPGFEVSGTVLDADGNSGFARGDPVCGQVAWGGYAEEVVAEPSRWIRLPRGADLQRAAAVPVSYVTAHIALHDRAALGDHDAVVVLAAAGGVGRAAIELAAGRSGPTIALVGDDAKRDIARAAGATRTINYRTEDWVEVVRGMTAGRGADIVLDPVGGDSTGDAIRALAWRGRLLIVGFASGSPAALPANRLLVKAASAHGIFWSHSADGELVAATQRDLERRIGVGAISPLVSEVFRFEEVPQAIARIEEGRTVGKLVVEVKR